MIAQSLSENPEFYDTDTLQQALGIGRVLTGVSVFQADVLQSRSLSDTFGS
jgi:hypothetical protein